MASREQYSDIITRCVRRNLPFALYMAPDDDGVYFFSQRPDESGECRADLSDPLWNGFFINFFNNDEPYVAGVAYDFDYDETLAELDYLESMDGLYMPADVAASVKSTTHMQHMAAVRMAVDEISRYKGKVVISQMTAVATTKTIGEVMWPYFDKFPSTFRFLVFTPETGLWLGATPELLVRYMAEAYEGSDAIVTMALAGTRLAGTPGDWDNKNLREHACVIDHLVKTLSDLNLEVGIEPTTSLVHGPVEHLCTDIYAGGTVDPVALLRALSPTPAVAGFPDKDKAAELIYRIESHQRHCYTGFAGIKNDRDLEAYVNLRSAMIVPCITGDKEGYLYNIYSGGGIMPQSDPQAEWEEVVAKMSTLYEIITGAPVPAEGAPAVENVTFPDYVSRRDFLMNNHYVQ